MRRSRSCQSMITCCLVVLTCSGRVFAQTDPDQTTGSTLAISPTSESTSVQASIPAAAASPQRKMPGFSDLFTPLGGETRRMFTQHNLLLVGIGAAGAMSAHNWDAQIARSGWGNGAVQETLEPGQVIGSFLVQTGGAVATYSIGRFTGNQRVAVIGAELFRAGLIAQGTTQMLKMATSRTRPDGTALSFPSGHAAAAFSTASVLNAELGWKVGVPAYGIAALVAASRVQAKRHYMSDVIAGATIGVLAGRSVTFGRGAARFSVSPMVVPGGVGASVVHVSSR